MNIINNKVPYICRSANHYTHLVIISQFYTHLVIIDLEKAYDKVSRDILWKALEKKRGGILIKFEALSNIYYW